jgi:hypothetical protein
MKTEVPLKKKAGSKAKRKQALLSAVGIWKDRTDLPDTEIYLRSLRNGERLKWRAAEKLEVIGVLIDSDILIEVLRGRNSDMAGVAARSKFVRAFVPFASVLSRKRAAGRNQKAGQVTPNGFFSSLCSSRLVPEGTDFFAIYF